MTTEGTRRRLGAITPRLVVDDVYDRLVELIVDGDVAPSAPLGIDALSRELGVSTSPVREALARLESTGLVERVAMRGYRVASALTGSELAQLLDARLVIEPAVVATVAQEHSEALVADLDAAVAALATAPRDAPFDTYRDYFEADRRFHRLLVVATGNRFLVQAYDALGGQFERFRLFSSTGVTDAEATIVEHGAIRDAIARGDAEAASAEMVRHLHAVRSRALAELAGQ